MQTICTILPQRFHLLLVYSRLEFHGKKCSDDKWITESANMLGVHLEEVRDPARHIKTFLWQALDSVHA